MGNRAKEKVLSLLGSVTIDLAAVAGTEVVLYTTPTGKQMIPVLLILDDFDEVVDESVITAGIGGGDCDEFVGDRTLTNIGAGFADECLHIAPIPNATPLVSCVLDAGETFAVEITTQETTGAATCIGEVWGRERDA